MGLIFYGYNGLKPIITTEEDPSGHPGVRLKFNKDAPFGDKFLVYPKFYSPDAPGDGSEMITYIFTPTKKTNIYDVPGVGEVIMNDPGNGEPWFDESIMVVFDKGFVPPKIAHDNTIDEDTGFSFKTFQNVGQALSD